MDASQELDGIQYVTNQKGEQTAVLIDLSLHGELWQDFYDLLLAEKRVNEPRESLDSVRQLLISEGKLDG